MIDKMTALTPVVAQAAAPDPLTEAALNVLRISLAKAKATQDGQPPPRR